MISRREAYQVILVVGLSILLAAARFLPHAPNFTPVLAMALFGGWIFGRRGMAFAIPLLSMALSDAIMGWHDTLWAVYLATGLAVYFGAWIPASDDGRFQWLKGAGAAMGASFSFYLITNYAVWMSGGMYSMSWEGLISCYVLAIPFFHNTLVSTMLFGAGAVLLYQGAMALWVPKRMEVYQAR